ncbi:Glycosyl transferase family 2 [Pedobacter steynii]|uniref:Glycosyl transferase family 2 n=1 Tax=Pedobacter steynii TaxID=430522 RepID=A0A1G9RXB2_9SPHI|nr:glycosyltransferase [Pedobacter steynii]NQX37633.1 glycosyltransferase [Pedobacter steynii]SDM27125.1 Glycosyl transferase family 2 [Pedobacter steynii]
MKRENPLISCICITSNRPLLMQRAIACFDSQDYPMKELVISYPENDLLTKGVLDQIQDLSNIKMVRIERSENEKLGVARNYAISAANGEFVCVWDDDDWHHPNRLSQQYSVIENGPFKASILMNILMYDSVDKETYYSGYRDWEGTLLCEKETMLKTRYLELERGEDTSVVYFLSSRNVLFRIIEMAHLYVYIYHGSNTWGEGHFNSYFLQSKLLEEDINQQIQEMTNLNYYTIRPTL